MSDLTTVEKMKVEKLFGMGSGYVLDFSNRTFAEFFFDNARVDIYDAKYNYESGSKANRLRAFWTEESNYLVGIVLSKLLEYWKTKKQLGNFASNPDEQELYDACQKIVERLDSDHAVVEQLNEIQTRADDREFSLLKKSIRESMLKNEPEVGLDRLHTFVTRYVRLICDKYEIEYSKKMPLHSMFGQYVRRLRETDRIESQITQEILSSSIKILESFNYVRNEQSLAHDNPVLNHRESMLIFNNIVNLVEFIAFIEEEEVEDNQEEATNVDWDEIPF